MVASINTLNWVYNNCFHHETGLLVIQYAGTVPTCRITAVSYLSPPLTPLPWR